MVANKLTITLALLCVCSAVQAREATHPYARLPIREITVFKDGHAYVLHRGVMPTTPSKTVEMDYLPNPVLGTFWAYSADPKVKVTAVTAGIRRVRIRRTSLSIPQMLEANVGADVTITEISGKPYPARVIGVPTRSTEEMEATAPPNTDPIPPTKSTVVLLKTAQGIQATPLARIRTVAFRSGMRPKAEEQEFRNLLTLKLDSPSVPRKADIGMIYLQKGIRWIPSYRVSLDGKGKASIKLQATLINELADLNDVTANLVIGVPSFMFQDTPDPIGLQQTLAQLSPYFQQGSQTGFGFSNAIMSQARMSDSLIAGRAYGGGFGAQGASGAPALGGDSGLSPVLTGSDKAEDLFVFTVKHITLKKRARMIVPVAEYTVPYVDKYGLDLPIAPPVEVRANVTNEQTAELARLLLQPKVMHRVCLTNDGPHPFTTAPALLLTGDKVLGQAMMTYTSRKGTADLDVTAASDISATVTERETGRQPNALNWSGSNYSAVNLEGTIRITNFRDKPATVAVTRCVLGKADTAGQDGTVEMVNQWEQSGVVAPGWYGSYNWPYWWRWYSWPWYWNSVNGIGRMKWSVTLQPGETRNLTYTWHYYWQ